MVGILLIFSVFFFSFLQWFEGSFSFCFDIGYFDCWEKGGIYCLELGFGL